MTVLKLKMSLQDFKIIYQCLPLTNQTPGGDVFFFETNVHMQTAVPHKNDQASYRLSYEGYFTNENVQPVT